MTKIRVIAGLVVLAVVSACGSEAGTTTPVVVGSQEVFAGAEGVLQSPEQQAGNQAMSAVKRYYETLDSVETNPAADLSVLNGVSVQPMTETLIRSVEMMRAEGVVVSGSRGVVAVSVIGTVAPKDEQGVPVPGEASADLRVCLDWSDYSAIRPDGGAVTADRPTMTLAKPTLVNSSWPDPGGWKVSWDLQTSVLVGYQSCDE